MINKIKDKITEGISTNQGSLYYSVNNFSGKPILVDRKRLGCPNGIMTGTPGSGKSFAAKREMISVLLDDPTSEVIVVDPQREYKKFAEELGGEVIYLSPGSNTLINPLDLPIEVGSFEDPINQKVDLMIALYCLLCGEEELSFTQKILIDRACRLIYQPYLDNPETGEIPTLKIFCSVLMEQPEPEATFLALTLEMYLNESLSIFSQKTNIDPQNRLTVYDINHFGHKLRPLCTMLALNQIWNRICVNLKAGRRTWVYFEEMELLLENDSLESYFSRLWIRARTHGAIFTGTLQVTEKLFAERTRHILRNCEFLMLFRQSAQDREKLAKLFNLSDKQLSCITNSAPGAGLFLQNGDFVPFFDEYQKDNEMYRIMTTRLE